MAFIFVRTEGVHFPAYHNRNERVIKQFKRFLEAKRPYLTKLSQLRPEVVEEYQYTWLDFQVNPTVDSRAGLHLAHV